MSILGKSSGLVVRVLTIIGKDYGLVDILNHNLVNATFSRVMSIDVIYFGLS